jgi:hypothetical protein
VPVQRADSYAGQVGDLLRWCVHAGGGENGPRGLDQRIGVASARRRGTGPPTPGLAEPDDETPASVVFWDTTSPQVRLRASQAPATGFRGFTLSLVVSQPATVEALIGPALDAGATPLKPGREVVLGLRRCRTSPGRDDLEGRDLGEAGRSSRRGMRRSASATRRT